MDLFFDRQGTPISRERWAAEFVRNRVVRDTDLGPLGRVSTIYLGLNHGWGGGPPLIFETLVIGGPMDEFMDRYATEEKAIGGHHFIVQALMYYRPEAKRPPLIQNGRKPRR